MARETRRHAASERQPPLTPGLRMKKQVIRRAVIREWMALPRDKRQTVEQAASFAAKAVHAHALPRSRCDPHHVMMSWLLPRTGRL
jgi:hypothetical protein